MNYFGDNLQRTLTLYETRKTRKDVMLNPGPNPACPTSNTSLLMGERWLCEDPICCQIEEGDPDGERESGERETHTHTKWIITQFTRMRLRLVNSGY